MKSLCFLPRFRRNSARMRKTSRVFTEIPFRQGKRGTFSPRFCFDGQNVARFLSKFRLDKQNAARFHRNSISTSKTSRVFFKILSGQAKRGTFSPKFRLDGQNAARFHENSVCTSKTSRVFVKIPLGRQKPDWAERAFAPGKHHPGGFSSKFRLDEENPSGRRPLPRRAATRAACLSAARPRRPWSAREACAAART